MTWQLVKRTDAHAIALADDHYSRQKKGAMLGRKRSETPDAVSVVLVGSRTATVHEDYSGFDCPRKPASHSPWKHQQQRASQKHACVQMRPGSVLTLIETYASGRLRPARLTGSLGQKLRALVAEPSTDHE